MNPWTRWTVGVALLATAAVSACDDDNPLDIDQPGEVGSILLNAEIQTLQVGGTFQIVATVRDEDGDLIGSPVLTFRSSDETVASVSGTGLVTALSEGTATITVESGDESATLTIVVESPVTVDLADDDFTITVGDTVRLAVTVRDADGEVVTDPDLVFTSSDEAVIQIDAEGLATAVGEGDATVTVEFDGVSSTADFTVEAATVGSLTLEFSRTTLLVGDTLHADVTLTNANGNPLPVEGNVTFTSSDEAVVTVTDAGVVEAVGAGTATVTAAAGGVEATVDLTVEGQVATVEVTPEAPTVAAGTTFQLTVLIRDADGNLLSLTGRTVTYASNDESVATVSATGLVNAVAPGTATITVSVDGVTDTSVVTVN